MQLAVQGQVLFNYTAEDETELSLIKARTFCSAAVLCFLQYAARFGFLCIELCARRRRLSMCIGRLGCVQDEILDMIDANMDGSGWGVAVKAGKQGYFPANFVNPL